MTQPTRWSVGAASEQGRREENQDRMTRFTSPFGELVGVADGMGGARGGATAAATVMTRLPRERSRVPCSRLMPRCFAQGIRAMRAWRRWARRSYYCAHRE